MIRLFFTLDVYGDNAAYCACNRQCYKVYPAELYVFEPVQSREYQKSEQHIGKSCQSTFQKSVLSLFEAYDNTDKHGYDFDCDVYGHYDLIFNGSKSDYDCENKHEGKRNQGCKQYCF